MTAEPEAIVPLNLHTMRGALRISHPNLPTAEISRIAYAALHAAREAAIEVMAREVSNRTGGSLR